VFLRERLFAVLDAHHAACGLWIAGPPGMGKTTLTATYLQARGVPCLWLQLDAADAAISTSLHSPRPHFSSQPITCLGHRSSNASDNGCRPVRCPPILSTRLARSVSSQRTVTGFHSARSIVTPGGVSAQPRLNLQCYAPT
jgi:hypothetical protein